LSDDNAVQSPLCEAADAEFRATLSIITADAAFADAWSTLDRHALSGHFNDLGDHARAYLQFHEAERGLWTKRVRAGRVDADEERAFLASIPAGILHHRTALLALDSCIGAIAASGMGDVVETRIGDLARRDLLDEHATIGRNVLGYVRSLGCDTNMIAAFRAHGAAVDHDYLGTAGGFDGLSPALHSGMVAETAILQYTQRHGFDYLRGTCEPPPAWPAGVSAVLAYAGISMPAWVAVAVVAAVIVVLVAVRALPVTFPFAV
jgi:hypothetical protein